MPRLLRILPAVLLLLLAAGTCTAQEKKEKSVFQRKRSAQPDGSHWWALLDAAEKLGADQRDSAFRMVENALLWSLDHGDPALEARSYAVLGGLFAAEDQCDLAISYYDKCVETSSDPYSASVMTTQLAKARCLRKSNRLLQARTELETLKAKTFSTWSNAPPYLIPEINNEIAAILLEIGDIARSGEVLQENEGYLNSTKLGYDKNAELEVETRMLQGALKFKEEKQGEAIGFFNNAWAATDSVSIPAKQYKLRSDIADQAKFNGAVGLAEQYRGLLSNNNGWQGSDQADRLANEVELGTAQRLNRKTDLAINTLNRALSDPLLRADSKDPRLLDVRMQALKGLSETHLDAGDPEKAQRYLNEYMSTLEVANAEKQKKLEANLGLFSSLTANVQRIKILEKDREINQKQIALLRTQGDLQASQLFSRNAIIGSLIGLVLLLAGLLFFRQRARNKERVAARLVELRSLRSQMNPHFIFNALNSVNHYVAVNDERKANRYLTDLSGLMRKVLSYSELEFIDLDDELELIEQYMRLEHERFSDRFDIDLQVDGSLKGAGLRVPPMLVQPFIENAIWHGLRHKEGKGLLSVKVKDTPGSVHFTITDDGIGRKRAAAIRASHAKPSKGIDNTRNRIALVNTLYRGSLTLTVDDVHADGSGTRVRFDIPKDLAHGH